MAWCWSQLVEQSLIPLSLSHFPLKLAASQELSSAEQDHFSLLCQIYYIDFFIRFDGLNLSDLPTTPHFLESIFFGFKLLSIKKKCFTVTLSPIPTIFFLA